MGGLKKTLVAAGMAIISIASVAPSDAGAWAWDPKVNLKGSAVCASSAATWVWVEASNGERGWATNGRGSYSFQFNRVPAGGMTVRVNYGNGTFRCTDSFGVKRPAVGTSATRNVVQIFPNG